MFLYYSGSIAYGIDGDDSDYDVTIVLDGFKGQIQVNYSNIDFMIYGSDCYMNRYQKTNDEPLYSVVKMDDIITLEKNLIYKNPSYETEYKALRSIHFEDLLKPYLKAFLAFQKVKRVNYLIPDKSMYHLLRLRGLLDHYDKYRQFEFIIEEPWFTKMLNYKKNWYNEIGRSYLPLIKEQVHYIENYYKRV
jgi:hypothetical protein